MRDKQDVAKWATTVAWRDTNAVVVAGEIDCDYWNIFKHCNPMVRIIRFDPTGEFSEEEKAAGVVAVKEINDLISAVAVGYKAPGRVEVIGSEHARLAYGAEVSAVVDRAVRACIEAEHTTRVNAERWTRLGFEALRQMNGQPLLNAAPPCLGGYTAVIVGAGPSLDRNIRELAKKQDDVVIFATDAAVNSLKKAGIQPHVIVTVEANDTPTKRTLQSPLWKKAVVVPGVHVHENVWKLTPRRWLWGVQMVGPIGPFVIRNLGLSVFKSGGSVSTVALSAAYVLGCSTFVLIGCDSAFGPNNKFYSKHVPWSGKTALQEQRTKVEAWGGIGFVEAPRTLCAYREWFEAIAVQLQKEGKKIINATEGGARMANVPEKRLKDVLDDCTPDEPPWDRLLAGVDAAGKLDGGLIAEELKKELEYGRAIAERSRKASDALMAAHDQINSMLQLPPADILFRSGIGPIQEAGMMPRGHEVVMGAKMIGRLADTQPILGQMICDTIKVLEVKRD